MRFLLSFFLFMIVSLNIYPAENQNTLNFEKAKQILINENKELKAIRYQIEKAKLEKQNSYKKSYPDIKGVFSYSRTETQLSSSNLYSLGANLTMPIINYEINYLKTYSDIEISKIEAEYKTKLSQLLYELRVLLANITEYKELYNISISIAEKRKKNYDIIKMKYNSGLESRSALLETETSLKLALWEMDNYKNKISIYEKKLNLLLNRPIDNKIEEIEIALPDSELNLNLNEIVNLHPEVLKTRLWIIQQKALIKLKTNERLPQLNFSSSISKSGADIKLQNKSWDISASLSVPIFSSGKISLEETIEKKNLSKLEEDLNTLIETIYVNSYEKLIDFNQSLSYYEIAKSSLESAKTRAWLVETQYLNGQSSYFEWKTEQDRVINEEKNLIISKSGIIIKYADFLRSIGE
ncbi:MAG TPA: TolC family protein [Elusimicrobiales bacterium]|nr:TolC family protein [Elusimicrobiales bacterium]HOL62221.1 TolC family protein [Elusimicrobiales bacterium]HPO94868.1 TolC family protein [Elusimicrobiales bacterium]